MKSLRRLKVGLFGILVFLLFWGGMPPSVILAEQSTERRVLYDQISAISGIAWYHLAAIDQYERTINAANPKTRPLRESLVAVYFTESEWVGFLNPHREDTNEKSISFFQGLGRDGSGDGLADRNNDLDVLYSLAAMLQKRGYSRDDFRIGLWGYYLNSRSVRRVEQFSKIYEKFQTLDLGGHAFPVPLRSDYSYRSTWGASRGWGGFRIHEGTDIFADYGVPVRSTCYGVIETMGWNRFGGWRIGLRSISNMYHYYAHLSGFNKQIKPGDVVQPGEVIGWVGSSGYGKPGTSGKFPPHLHYGMYRDSGFLEWSFDPYPFLRRWEQEERRR